MGLAASQARLMLLVSEISNDNYQLQQIREAMLSNAKVMKNVHNSIFQLQVTLSNDYSESYNNVANVDTDSENEMEAWMQYREGEINAQIATLNSKLQELTATDTLFQNQAERLEATLKANQTELDGVKKVVEDNIKKSYNLFSSG